MNSLSIINELKKLFQGFEMRRYTSFPNSLASFEAEKRFLEHVGLPVLNGSHISFFPTQTLEVITIDDRAYLVVGNTCQENRKDYGYSILLNIEDKKAYSLNEKFFDAGILPYKILAINSNLLGFLYFSIKIDKSSQRIFNSKSISSEDIMFELKDLMINLSKVDPFGLNINPDSIHFWGGTLIGLELDIYAGLDINSLDISILSLPDH